MAPLSRRLRIGPARCLRWLSRRQCRATKIPLSRDQVPEMIRVVLTDAVYDAIASTLPKGAARWPIQRDRDQCFIQVEAAVVDRMNLTAIVREQPELARNLASGVAREYLVSGANIRANEQTLRRAA